jgi:pre-mRNA cleavage complex 2 protein Pcf11
MEENEVYVLPPQDAAKLNEPCSICMEPFKSVWHLKTQQPVWMDTVKVGNKYYHASCYKEATAGRGMAVRNGARSSNRATPEPVLGKRKYANAVS